MNEKEYFSKAKIVRNKDHFVKGARMRINSAISSLNDAIGLVNVGFYDAAARQIAEAHRELDKAVEDIAMLPPRESKEPEK